VAKTSNPPRFDPASYSKITLNDLVVYSIYYLHKQRSEIAAEDVISACFVLFPKRFALRKYPQWPDSGIVSRRWGDCKSKGYLRGNAVKGFALTARGSKRAEKVEKALGKPLKPIRVRKPTASLKGKAERPVVPAVEAVHPELKAHAKKYVRSMEMSDAYKNYKKRKPLNEFDFRSLLLCTMETPPETLTRNLEQFKEYASLLARDDMLKFLAFCADTFAHMLSKPSEPAKKKRRVKKGK